MRSRRGEEPSQELEAADDPRLWGSRLKARRLRQAGVPPRPVAVRVDERGTFTRTELFPLTTFSFNGAAGSVQEFQLVKFIPAIGCVSGVLELRIASRSLPTTQVIAIVLQAISLADDEEEATYVTSDAETVAEVGRNYPPNPLPKLLAVSLKDPVPAFYRLLVRATQEAATPVAFQLTASASVIMRSQ